MNIHLVGPGVSLPVRPKLSRTFCWAQMLGMLAQACACLHNHNKFAQCVQEIATLWAHGTLAQALHKIADACVCSNCKHAVSLQASQACFNAQLRNG